MLKLQQYKKMSGSNAINMLIANKGNYVYYIEFTDELLLSKEKFPNGNLILTLDEGAEFELGAVTYVGEL